MAGRHNPPDHRGPEAVDGLRQRRADRGEPVTPDPASIEQGQVWVAGKMQLKVINVDGDRVSVERIAGVPNHAMHRPFTVEAEQLRAAYTYDKHRGL